MHSVHIELAIPDQGQAKLIFQEAPTVETMTLLEQTLREKMRALPRQARAQGHDDPGAIEYDSWAAVLQ